LCDPEKWIFLVLLIGIFVLMPTKLSKVLSERNVHHWFDIRQDRVMTGTMEGNVSL
jgi:hypothetical protein